MENIVINPEIITTVTVTLYLGLFLCYQDIQALFRVVQRGKVGAIFDYISVRVSAIKTWFSSARLHMFQT